MTPIRTVLTVIAEAACLIGLMVVVPLVILVLAAATDRLP